MGNVYTPVALKVSMSEITWHQYITYFVQTYTVHLTGLLLGFCIM